MLESCSETELELTPETNGKSYNISLLVILTVLMAQIGLIEVALPVPLGMFILYLFKDFGVKAVQALMLSNVLTLVETMMFFNILMLGYWILNVMLDAGLSSIAKRGNFQFGNWDVFRMGFISALPSFIIVIPVAFVMWSSPEMVFMYPPILVYSITLMVVYVMTAIPSAIMYMIGFRGVKSMMKTIFRIDTIKMV